MEPQLPIESVARRTPLRVLFFEDDEEDIALSLRALKSSEFEVTPEVAVTPEEFLERVRSREYDVILSDFRMPNADGMEIFKLIKNEGVNIPFILVTGALGDEKAVECLKEGVADYVIKDRLARLPVAIRRAIEERRLRLARAEAVQALRRSEASYRSLIKSAPCGVLRLSASDGRLMEVNSALCEMLGYASSSELIQRSEAGDIALDPERLNGLTNGGAGGDQVVESEIEWKRKDGAPLLVRLSGRLLRDEGGAPACLEMIAENITERHYAQQRIRQLNRLYSVLSHVGRAIVRVRTRDELLQEICRILVEDGNFQMAWVGLLEEGSRRVKPAAQWADQGYLDGIEITVNDEAAGHGVTGSAIRERRHVICNDVLTDPRMELWWQRAKRLGYRSAGSFPISVRGSAIGSISMYAGELGSFDDEGIALLDELAANVSFALERIAIEQLHNRAVEQLNQFFALSLDMLCIATIDGYIRRLNAAWEKTLGFSPVEMCSRRWIEFVHPDDREQARMALSRLQSGDELSHLELRFLSKSGGYRWLVGSATPVLDQGLVFAAMSDITERKNLEERLRNQNLELEEQNRRVEAASRMKSEFLANMSHELRSPLNGILGFTELLYDGKLGAIPERPREFLGRVHSSATHLLSLINAVLDLSKVEAGRLEFRPEMTSVPSVIHDVMGILGTLAAEKQIRMEAEIDPRVKKVVADPARLKQVLHNYLSNALKFTGPKGRVVVRLKSEGIAEFRLEVSDTGVGISAEDLARLFVEFQQLDVSKAKRYQGTGLGLALTKRIVEAQGGRVGVESKPGQGSTFFAVLPCEPATTPAGLPVASILIIEDDKVARLALTRRLESNGYRVDTAGNCLDALEKCRRSHFNAITLDAALADGSGWEALRQIRLLPRFTKTPVIVVSTLEQRDVAILEPVQGFLSKPIALPELLGALEQAGVPAGTARVHI